MNLITVFFLGGYLVPAAYFTALVFLEDRDADDEPTVFESGVTALSFGLIWPFAPHKFTSEP